MATQIILDGPRNVVVKVTDVDAATGTAIDVSTLVPACTAVNIDKIWWAVPATGSVALLWDADTDLLAINLVDAQDFDLTPFGGLTNNAGTGVTGDILYAGTGTGTFTFILHCTKRGIIAQE